MIKKIFQKTEKYFQEGTWEEFTLHRVLLFSNSFLLFLLFIQIFFYWNSIEPPFIIKYIEIFFGILFLMELIFYLIHVYIPNKIFFKPRIIMNTLVVISLLMPGFIANLAFLRLIQSIKVIKVFLYSWQIRQDLKKHPHLRKK